MGTTIVVPVRKALVAALAPVINGTAGMSDIPVGFQFPTGNDIPREAIWTQGGPLNFTSASMRQGRNLLDEKSGFDLMFRASGPDITPEEAADRVTEIATVAVDWINDHKNADLWPAAPDGLNWLVIEGAGESAEFPAELGYGAGLRIPISFQARLT